MFRIDEYIDKLIVTLKDMFGERLLYIGLQGSYLRNEATENSDIAYNEKLLRRIEEFCSEIYDGRRKNYVKFSLNNFYHEVCHRYIHADREANISNLPITCKSVFFIMQHLYYLSSGKFISTKRELLECVQGENKAALELSISLKNDTDYDFDRAFSVLFGWCQNALAKI